MKRFLRRFARSVIRPLAHRAGTAATAVLATHGISTETTQTAIAGAIAAVTIIWELRSEAKRNGD